MCRSWAAMKLEMQMEPVPVMLSKTHSMSAIVQLIQYQSYYEQPSNSIYKYPIFVHLHIDWLQAYLKPQSTIVKVLWFSRGSVFCFMFQWIFIIYLQYTSDSKFIYNFLAYQSIQQQMDQSQLTSLEGIEMDPASLLQKLKNLQKSNKKQVKMVSFARQIDYFYCDIVLQNDENLRISLTSQLDATLFELILNKESKRDHEGLNFFQSNLQIYEYLMENLHENVEKQEQKFVKVDQNGKITIKVISTIGKKQRQKLITLSTLKKNENKDIYLQKLIKKFSKSMLQLKKQLSEVKQSYKTIQKHQTQLLQRLSTYGQKIIFVPDKSDSHYGKFNYLDKKVVKIVDNTTYFSLYHDKPISKSGVSYFNTKVMHCQSKNIMIGIASKFTKGIPNVYSHEDYIGFYLYGKGHVWSKGNQRDLNLLNHPMQDGITITTNVHMSEGYVNWQICGVIVGYCTIPLELKAKQLYPVVLLINVNDTIQFV